MNFAKLKKLTIVKTITTIILSISLVFCNVIPVFASTAVDQESLYPILKTSGTSYLYPVTGNSKTVSRYTNITDLLAQYADQSTLNQKTVYTYLSGTIKGYIDGIETSLTSIDTKLTTISGYIDGVETGISNIGSKINTLNGYVDGLEGYLDGVEGYIDGLETAFTTNNTRLNEIKNAINNITTYNYTQVLSDILTNTGYLSTIDIYTQSIQDSIGYGTSGDNVLSKLTSLISSNSNIDTNTSNIYNLFNNSLSIPYSYIQDNSVFPESRNPLNLNVSSGNGILKLTSNAFSSGSTYNYFYDLTPVSTQNSFTDVLGVLNNNTVHGFNYLISPKTIYRLYTYNASTNNLEAFKINNNIIQAFSIADFLHNYFKSFELKLGKLQYAIADDEMINAKKANKNQERAVLSNFTGSGSASASSNDFGDIASGVAIVNSGLNTGVSISNIFNIYNNRDGYGFWSVETQNELNTTNSSRSYKSNRSSSTPLYDSKLSEIYSYMGVNHD